MLEALPAGHPSSPYLADGRRRDPEPALRSLEVPPPADRRRNDEPPSPESSRPDYWHEVPRFKRMWAEHEARWPKDQQTAAAIDRSRDPPGSWRSDSDLFLDPDVHARTRDEISQLHDAEPQLSDDLMSIVHESVTTAKLVGFDHRLKGEERLKEKIAETLRDNPDSTPDEVVRAIPDVLGAWRLCV